MLDKIQEDAWSWVGQNSMYYKAQKGVSADLSVYESLDPKMTKAPTNLLESYSQAVYFLSLAARRADGTGNDGAASRLKQYAASFANRGEKLSSTVSLLCSGSGYCCPKKGSAALLHEVEQIVRDSGLSDYDSLRIGSILKRNARSFTVRRSLPYVGLFGVGFVAIRWWAKNRA